MPACKKIFRRKGDMQRHVLSVHRLSTPFNCKVCDRKFTRKDKLNEHLRHVHTMGLDSSKWGTMFAEPSILADAGSVIPGDTMREP